MIIPDGHAWSVNSSSFLASSRQPPDNNVQFRFLDCYRGNSPRAQRGFGGRQATLFTARFQLWYSPTCFTCVDALCHVYFEPLHPEVLNCSLHGNDAGRATWLEKLRSCQRWRREKKKRNFACRLWQVQHVLTLRRSVFSGLCRGSFANMCFKAN